MKKQMLTFVNWRNSILEIDEAGRLIDAVFFSLFRITDLDESDALKIPGSRTQTNSFVSWHLINGNRT